MAQVQSVHVSPSRTVTKTVNTQGCAFYECFQRFPTSEACAAALRRLALQQKLEHTNICRVEAVWMEGMRVLEMKLEWCGEDLKSISQGYKWTQEDCWVLLCSVVSALAYAQRQGIAHGSLRMDAIYKSEEGVYKVSDFQCPDSPRKGETLWEEREPFYLSPGLRNAYARLLVGEDVDEVDCDAYKSDVYSMGLILISLLKPASFARLSNRITCQQTIESLPISQDFKAALCLMLEADETTRPDWLALEQSFHSEQPKVLDFKEENKSPNRKKRPIIIKKVKSAEVTGQSGPEQSNRPCMHCEHVFLLNSTDSWRLDLIGSESIQPSTNYCSLSCFQQSPFATTCAGNQAPASAPSSQADDKAILGLAALIGTALLVGQNTDEEMPRYYHCHRHTVISENNRLSEIPTVLSQCKACPTGEIRTEVLLPLQVSTAWNNMYPGLVFMHVRILSKEIPLYQPISEQICESLARAECHICAARIQPNQWIIFFHSEKPDLVCSAECFRKGAETGFCPMCNAPIPEDYQRMTYKDIEFFIGSPWLIDESLCRLCMLRHGEWLLPCGHSLCLYCLSLIPNHRDMDSFGCPHCGQVLAKEENRDLLGAIGWDV